MNKEELFLHWEDYFKENGIDKELFTTKLVFKPKEWDKKEYAVTFFLNELPKKNEVKYIELIQTDRNKKENTPLINNNKRFLYKLVYRPIEEYTLFKRMSSSNKEYEVCAIKYKQLELHLDKKISNVNEEVINEDFLNELELASAEDAPFNSMTIRDFYCILHNVPKTRQKWLNKLIIENGKK